MPWWGWIWVAVTSLIMVAGTVDDLDERVPRWKVLLDVVGHAGTVVLFFSFFSGRLAEFLGRWLVLLLIVSALWGVGRAIDETRSMPADPAFSQQEDRQIRFVATVVWGALMVPAWVFGAISATTHW